MDEDDRVYLASSHGVRMVRPDGTIDTIVDSESEEDDSTTTRSPPDALALDPHGNLYFTQPSTNQVQVVVRPADMGSMSGTQVALIALGALGLVALLAAVGLRDQLDTLARNPRRIPGAVGTLPVLALTTCLVDGLSCLERRLGRTEA
ncbi:hypothetical protein RIF23_09380 [Lipingzhangella sp. LS1_29]|uniref:SMP-30/Gluconolactonase/LRE-like region domain-containing protein n=1 Tax=Lipingzhangella rawalii TaxID=2055835 RepID=A0ABU2H5C5_9ACTN|nr:hypothetical protein [Lipingzhangella rawalii]MDS1270506.1 hypothetical protein [Lipingzhangella rawalii]